MAARRLLILMLLLLGLSTLAAALMDPRRLSEEERRATSATETTATGTSGETAAEEAPTGAGPVTAAGEDEVQPAREPTGKRLGATIEIGERVKVVPIRVGDQLSLRVKWDRPGLVEIPALGLLEPVAPGAPARFDLLGSEAVSYGVRLLDPGRLVARIEVRNRGKGASGRARPASRPSSPDGA